MEDELARRRKERTRVELPAFELYQQMRAEWRAAQPDLPPLKALTSALVQEAWEQLSEALAWARSAEDAIETSDYRCLSCERDVGVDEHDPGCVGAGFRAARRSLEHAKAALEAKHPEAFG